MQASDGLNFPSKAKMVGTVENHIRDMCLQDALRKRSEVVDSSDWNIIFI